MNQTIGFGILGCGMIASYHAEAISHISGARLVGAFDASPATCESFCGPRGIQPFSSAESLFQSPEIQAVCICLPSGLHKAYALHAAARGKHFILEKPMALNCEDCDEIISACDTFKVKGAVISQLRCSEAVSQMRRAVEQGWLGRVVTGDIYMKYHRDKSYYTSSPWKGTRKMDGGGALMNQGIHGVDVLQYIMGPVRRVSALSKTLVHSIETEDTLSALLEYENGALGVIQATTSVYPGFGRKIEICGSEGSITACEDAIVSCAFSRPDVPLKQTEGGPLLDAGSRPDSIDCSGHVTQLADFVDFIRTGSTPLVDVREGKKPVALICSIYESARLGKPVSL